MIVHGHPRFISHHPAAAFSRRTRLRALSAALPLLLLLLMGLAASVAAPTWAAEVYRCGQTYQDTPCPGAKTVQVDDKRDASQQQAARAVAAAEQRQAAQLAAERQTREAPVRVKANAAPKPAAKPAPVVQDPCSPGHRLRKKNNGCPGEAIVYRRPAASAPQALMKP